MRITNKKIIEALEEGDYITSPKFPRHVYLRLRDNSLELIDWGQSMNCEEFVYNNFMGLMKDDKMYICFDSGDGIKKRD